MLKVQLLFVGMVHGDPTYEDQVWTTDQVRTLSLQPARTMQGQESDCSLSFCAIRGFLSNKADQGGDYGRVSARELTTA